MKLAIGSLLPDRANVQTVGCQLRLIAWWWLENHVLRRLFRGKFVAGLKAASNTAEGWALKHNLFLLQNRDLSVKIDSSFDSETLVPFWIRHSSEAVTSGPYAWFCGNQDIEPVFAFPAFKGNGLQSFVFAVNRKFLFVRELHDAAKIQVSSNCPKSFLVFTNLWKCSNRCFLFIFRKRPQAWIGAAKPQRNEVLHDSISQFGGAHLVSSGRRGSGSRLLLRIDARSSSIPLCRSQ